MCPKPLGQMSVCCACVGRDMNLDTALEFLGGVDNHNGSRSGDAHKP